MTATTIKVSSEVRDKVMAAARARGLSAAAFVGELLDEHDRARRFEAFGAAFALADASYQRDVEVWDATSADGPGEWVN